MRFAPAGRPPDAERDMHFGDVMTEEKTFRRWSKVIIFVHFIWATKSHTDQIPTNLERRVHRIISAEVESMKGEVLAIGGMSDHVHLLVQMPGMVSASQLMKQVKGISSTFINENRPGFSEQFRWQDGYGAFSAGTGEAYLARVISYIRHQKEHHANHSLIPEWEETGEIIEV
jgi:putative transposase